MFEERPSPFMDERDPPSMQAAALKYDPSTDAAPRVVAIGREKSAEQIIAIARENGIPIHEDPFLVAALAKVDIGGFIPPELYLIVAEILAYIYRVNERYLLSGHQD
jgi:flagellar biosynthesis protein